MSNRSEGNQFEREFCKVLSGAGFWVHNLTQNSAGQPADVIAVNKTGAYLIDCKIVSGKKFAMSRVEDNQHTAMQLWDRLTGHPGWFAIKFPEDRIYMISYDGLAQIGMSDDYASECEISDFGRRLEGWIDDHI